MAVTAVGSSECSERTAMERFGSGGKALLPWTKQILTLLWEQLRLLLQVIYYSFMSVFQMMRFEVHVRITDESVEHIQHMTSSSSPSESFLFTQLFDGGDGGSSPLSGFCAEGSAAAESLLNTLRADDLCCGLVDDFVSGEDGLFLGHPSAWNMGFPNDWNIFVSGGSDNGSSDPFHPHAEKAFKRDSSEEERSSVHWSSEEDKAEFDNEESKELWESLSKSSDPYNPFFFSACITTTNATVGKGEEPESDPSAAELTAGTPSEEMPGPGGRLSIWVCRSDSESSWASSDSDSPDLDREESDRLLEFFSSPDDPYNPMCFTACTLSSNTSPKNTEIVFKEPDSLGSKSDTDTDERTSSISSSSSSEDDEEEYLWKSLSIKNDPYHPLNFKASLNSSFTPAKTTAVQSREEDKRDFPHTNRPTKGKKSKNQAEPLPKSRATKPTLPERHIKQHSHPDKTLVPWKRPTCLSQPEQKASDTQKKVRFSSEVAVHVMRTWPFARQASRRGPWEEVARDRDRFRRRVQETEQAIGHCFTPSHRDRLRAYLDGAFK